MTAPQSRSARPSFDGSPTFFAFPLLVVDLPVALYDERHRRAFDRVAVTVVVTDPEDGQAPHRREIRGLEAHVVLYLFVNAVLIYLWAIGEASTSTSSGLSSHCLAGASASPCTLGRCLGGTEARGEGSTPR